MKTETELAKSRDDLYARWKEKRFEAISLRKSAELSRHETDALETNAKNAEIAEKKARDAFLDTMNMEEDE